MNDFEAANLLTTPINPSNLQGECTILPALAATWRLQAGTAALAVSQLEGELRTTEGRATETARDQLIAAGTPKPTVAAIEAKANASTEVSNLRQELSQAKANLNTAMGFIETINLRAKMLELLVRLEVGLAPQS